MRYFLGFALGFYVSSTNFSGCYCELSICVILDVTISCISILFNIILYNIQHKEPVMSNNIV